MGIGEMAALSAAFLWTISSFLWGRIRLTAFELNICKNIMATLLLFLHIAVLVLFFGSSGDDAKISTNGSAAEVSTSQNDSMSQNDSTSQIVEESKPGHSGFQMIASPTAWGWLALSGVIGIVLGDTLYFRSLQILGPRRSLVIATSSPLFAIVAGWWLLEEVLTVSAVFGVLLTTVGIAVVVGEKKANREALDLFPGKFSTGLVLGLLAAVCQAVGLACSKVGMAMDGCSPLEATFVRIFAAAILSLIIITGSGKVMSFFKKVIVWKILKVLVLASTIGTWLGIWMSQVAVQQTEVAIAQTLLSTSPLFAIPMVYFLQGIKTSLVAILGTLVAIVGIGLTVW